jgi:hypothetical protein
MAQSRSNFVYLLVLLAAALAFGAAHRAQACPQGMSGSEHLPCCDGMDQPAMDPPGIQHSLSAPFDCATARGRPQGCTSMGHCVCSQPGRVAQVTARETRAAILAPSPVLMWPEQPVAGRVPSTRGPPDEGSADPPGRHAYLATLRLRI